LHYFLKLSIFLTCFRDHVISTLITSLATYRPVATFQDLVGRNAFLGGQDFCCYYMFKTNFSGRNEIWGSQKKFVGQFFRMPLQWLRAWPPVKSRSLSKISLPMWFIPHVEHDFIIENMSTSLSKLYLGVDSVSAATKSPM